MLQKPPKSALQLFIAWSYLCKRRDLSTHTYLYSWAILRKLHKTGTAFVPRQKQPTRKSYYVVKQSELMYQSISAEVVQWGGKTESRKDSFIFHLRGMLASKKSPKQCTTPNTITHKSINYCSLEL